MLNQESKKKILVVGGYGKVGRTISSKLGSLFPGVVVAAGPSLEKASSLAQDTDGAVIPLQFDVFDPSPVENVFEDIAIVIMCLDQYNTSFVKECIKRGIHYIDITASYAFVAKLEQLDKEAREHKSTVVLSVGLAPGITNLLASHAKSKFNTLQGLDIFILLGLGEAHGEAAIRWSLEKMNAKYTVLEDGETKAVRGFGRRKKTVFPGSIGDRWAYSFDFSDQHVIPRTLGVNSVATWMTFDSAPMTTFYAWAKKLGVFRLLDFAPFMDMVVRLLGRFQIGSDQYVLQVDSSGVINGERRTSRRALTGRNEGKGTALVAAQVAENLLTDSYPAGVFHIEQLFEPLEFIQQLQNADGSMQYVEEGEL